MENSTGLQNIFYAFIIQLLFHIPTITVYIIGIVAAFTKSGKYPRISFLSGAGFSILLILTIFSTLFSLLLPYFYSQKYNVQNISYIFSVVNVITLLISAGAAVLLLQAVWKERP